MYEGTYYDLSLSPQIVMPHLIYCETPTVPSEQCFHRSGRTELGHNCISQTNKAKNQEGAGGWDAVGNSSCSCNLSPRQLMKNTISIWYFSSQYGRCVRREKWPLEDKRTFWALSANRAQRRTGAMNDIRSCNKTHQVTKFVKQAIVCMEGLTSFSQHQALLNLEAQQRQS